MLRHLDGYFDAAPTPPADLASSVEEFAEAQPAFGAYRAALATAETAFSIALREAAHASGVRVMGAARPEVDIVMVGAYGRRPTDVESIARQARADSALGQQVAVLLRMGFDGPSMGTPIGSEEQMVETTRAAAAGGADLVGYYNYAEAPRRSVAWIRPALDAVGLTTGP